MKKLFTLLFLSLLCTTWSFAQDCTIGATVGSSCTLNTDGTLTIPAGDNLVISVEAWGAGGSSNGGDNKQRAGGGGGAYYTNTYTVDAGDMFSIVVGAPALENAPGGSSIFDFDGNGDVVVGGGGFGSNTVGVGGMVTGVVGAGTSHNGGSGGERSTTGGNKKAGGGGGGAGTSSGAGGDGGDAMNNTAGTAGSPGGGGVGGKTAKSGTLGLGADGSGVGSGAGGQGNLFVGTITSGGSGQVIVTVTQVLLANDDCTNAIALVPATATAYDTAGATDSGVTGGSCLTTPDDDIWFSITTDSDGDQLTVALSGSDEYELFQTDCSMSLGCASPFTVMSNTTYYLRIADPAVAGLVGGADERAAGMVTVAGSALVLPVELLSFSARKKGNEVALNWSTSIEINNDYFTIEKSTDGRNFSTLAKVAGAGDSDAVIEYDFMDEKPAIGKNYYRLKQTDFDGAFEYFNVQTVDFKGDENVSIYPNPVTDRLTVSTSNEAAVTVQIFNLMGQLVQQSNQKTIDLADVAVGTYFVKVMDSATNAVLFEDKLIKQ